MKAIIRSHWRLAAGLFLIVLVFAASRPAAAAGGESKLNVVFLVDDLGWMDLSCRGSEYYETPNIDRLARQGMRFTSGYAACAVCSPTRSAVQTGRYPARLGITDWIRMWFQTGLDIMYSSIRSGQWKLIKHYEGLTFELYNLAHDLSEKKNLAPSIPKQVRELDEKLASHLEDLGVKLPKRNPARQSPNSSSKPTMAATIRVDYGDKVGEISPLVYGGGFEHVADVTTAEAELRIFLAGDNKNVAYLDVVATRDPDQRTLILKVVNKSPNRAVTADIELAGLPPGEPTADVVVLTLTAADVTSSNRLTHPRDVCIEKSILKTAASKFTYAFPPHSATVLQSQATLGPVP